MGGALFDGHHASAKSMVTIGDAELPAIIDVWSKADAASAKVAEIKVDGLIMNWT